MIFDQQLGYWIIPTQCRALLKKAGVTGQPCLCRYSAKEEYHGLFCGLPAHANLTDYYLTGVQKMPVNSKQQKLTELAEQAVKTAEEARAKRLNLSKNVVTQMREDNHSIGSSVSKNMISSAVAKSIGKELVVSAPPKKKKSNATKSEQARQQLSYEDLCAMMKKFGIKSHVFEPIDVERPSGRKASLRPRENLKPAIVEPESDADSTYDCDASDPESEQEEESFEDDDGAGEAED